MRYWDTSALVPLVVEERGTELVRKWLKEDPRILTWGGSRIEVTSAVERRAREGRISSSLRRRALRQFEGLFVACGEIVDLLTVRSKALPLLARHPLRAADATHLGAAIIASESDPASLAFVCLDTNLADAADREGFPVLTWPDAI
jgi:uncharacterized protein